MIEGMRRSRTWTSCITAVVLLGSVALVGTSACGSGDGDPSTPADESDLVVSARISRPAVERVVAIGDVHGDLEVTRQALRLAGAIDDRDTWIGGRLVVVQTGDEIDREDGDRAILDFVERLKSEAKRAGGELIALLGNHELMNTELDFRYVTPQGFASFADVAPAQWMLRPLSDVDAKARGRGAAFLPGGPYAKILADRPLFMKVGDSVFVHGGLLPKHLAYGLDKMNDQVQGWCRGTERSVPEIVDADDGPLWLRLYSERPTPADCATLDTTLAKLQAKRLVMGHTVQELGINPTCGDHAWRIDTGLSSFYGGKLEVLEIRGGAVNVLRGE